MGTFSRRLPMRDTPEGKEGQARFRLIVIVTEAVLVEFLAGVPSSINMNVTYVTI
ncbi:hypothetical protein DPMN_025801 [Dreissena polymorpha]|uniref:Uncharacterized protein n=1 Tax=Dreissena polymorpha TaxID=45954 RepID=A0A9D4LTX9_DREPO|nr:hypothetical protein DPMN_025801 [Dreissena polymorpha]